MASLPVPKEYYNGKDVRVKNHQEKTDSRSRWSCCFNSRSLNEELFGFLESMPESPVLFPAAPLKKTSAPKTTAPKTTAPKTTAPNTTASTSEDVVVESGNFILHTDRKTLEMMRIEELKKKFEEMDRQEKQLDLGSYDRKVAHLVATQHYYKWQRAIESYRGTYGSESI